MSKSILKSMTENANRKLGMKIYSVKKIGSDFSIYADNGEGIGYSVMYGPYDKCNSFMHGVNNALNSSKLVKNLIDGKN